MKTIYLIRGCPGSGKTTMAQELKDALTPPDWFTNDYIPVMVAADDFMVDKDGNYDFIRERLNFCHLQCRMSVKNSMALGMKVIIVHNTFTTEKELNPYLKLAEEHGYKVVSLIVENRHGSKSIHGVPEETLTAMKSRFSVKL